MNQTTIKSKSNEEQNANNREREREREMESNNSTHKTSTPLLDDWEIERELDRQREAQKKIRGVIPEEYWNATTAESSIAGFGRDIVANVSTGAGLYFVGGVGVGKTWLACGVGADALRAGILTVDFKTSSEICYEFAGAYKANTSELTILQRLSRIELLIIDDLGKEKEDGKCITRLFEVINKRSSGHKSTIFTTNFDEPQLKKLWSRYANPVTIEAIFSRLSDPRYFRKVVLEGPDRRLNGGASHA